MTDAISPLKGIDAFFVPEFDLKIKGRSSKQLMRDIPEVSFHYKLGESKQISFSASSDHVAKYDPAHIQAPVYQLIYGRSLIQFQPTITTNNEGGKESFTAIGSTQGLPNLQSGAVIQIDGVGKQCNGR